MTSGGDNYSVNKTVYGQDVIASHFTIYKDKIRQKLLLFYLEYVKISYAYCRILDWAKNDKSFRSYVASTISYRHNSYQKVQAAQGTKNGLDLLEEFDKGMKVIESWKVGDEAE